MLQNPTALNQKLLLLVEVKTDANEEALRIVGILYVVRNIAYLLVSTFSGSNDKGCFRVRSVLNCQDFDIFKQFREYK